MPVANDFVRLCELFCQMSKRFNRFFALNGSEERIPFVHAQAACQKAQMSQQAFA
jgi:hypothetical protein